MALVASQMLLHQTRQSRHRGIGLSSGSSTGNRTEQKPGKHKSLWQSIQQRFRAKQPIIASANEWWTVAAQYNSALSSVYRLPDELLLEICRELKGADIYILRQSCSRFRRILSDPEFVSDTKWSVWIPDNLSKLRWKPNSPYRCEDPIFTQLPNLRVNWSDVYERLRRRGSCLACLHSRTPTEPGGESTFSATMRRMRERVKYCVACQRQHPLLMFSPHQRKTEDGAVCVMVEGGITICPHRRVSLKMIENWKKASTTSLLGETHNPPWMLRCDTCFSEFDDALRCTAMPPSATYISTRVRRDSIRRFKAYSPDEGSLCVQWYMPLPLDTKAALSENKANRRCRYESNLTPKFEKTRPLLSKLAHNYSELLCHHAKFNSVQMLADFEDGLAYEATRYRLEKSNSEIVLTAHGFQEINSQWNWSQNTGSDYALSLNETLKHDFCMECTWHVNLPPGAKLDGEYSWSLDERGLSLQRHWRLAVPNLEAASIDCDHIRWLLAMDPSSYGLTLDEELRHITWCPDEQCYNGKSKGFAGHRKSLEDLAELLNPGQRTRYLPLCVSGPVHPLDRP